MVVSVCHSVVFHSVPFTAHILGQIITSSCAKVSSGRHTIRIKVDDGKITSIEHAYSASGSVSLGYGNTATLKYTGSSDVTFD